MDTQTRAEPTTSNHPVPYRVTSPPLASRFATRVRSLLSLLAITGLLVGVPLALIVLVGWPLPTAVPPSTRCATPSSATACRSRC